MTVSNCRLEVPLVYFEAHRDGKITELDLVHTLMNRCEFLDTATAKAMIASIRGRAFASHIQYIYILHNHRSGAIATQKSSEPMNGPNVSARPDAASTTSILEEAAKAVNNDRQAEYGDPVENWVRTALIATITQGKPITPVDVVQVMCGHKMVRAGRSYKHDNNVDQAGYAEIRERVQKAWDDGTVQKIVEQLLGGWVKFAPPPKKCGEQDYNWSTDDKCTRIEGHDGSHKCGFGLTAKTWPRQGNATLMHVAMRPSDMNLLAPNIEMTFKVRGELLIDPGKLYKITPA